MKRIAPALVFLAAIAAFSNAQPPPGGPPPGRGPAQGTPPGPRGPAGPPPPFPGDTTAAERDSLMNQVMKSIAGKEGMAAESVFKDIQMFKGRRAGEIARIMNYGFGRSLAVSCFHCHAQNDWAKNEKKGKRIAREMGKMVGVINADHISKIEGLGENPDQKPTVNCSTCHRGSVETHGVPGQRPGGGR